MNRKDYIREQIRKSRQLVTGDRGNSVRPEGETPRGETSEKEARVAKHGWGL